MFKTTVFLSALLMLLGGCSGPGPNDQEVTGSATFTLTTTGSQDIAFRLASAELEISGPESVLLTPAEGEATALATLAPGAYVSRLLDGWRLQQNTGGTWKDMAAQLEDDPEKPFSIAAGEVTEIVYRFTADSECLSLRPVGSRDTAAIHGAAAFGPSPVRPVFKAPPAPAAILEPPVPAPGL